MKRGFFGRNWAQVALGKCKSVENLKVRKRIICFVIYYKIFTRLRSPGVASRCFLSVVVITCALHAQGRRFEPGRKHSIFLFTL